MANSGKIETCGCWFKGDIQPGEAHGTRGSIKWGRVGRNAVVIAMMDVGGMEGEDATNFQNPFTRVCSQSELASMLVRLAKLCDFDAVEAMAISQGIDPAHIENEDEVRQWAGIRLGC